MAKAAYLLSALCVLAITAIATGKEVFNVEGDVYCDPCRVQFETPLSKKLSGAGVVVECRNIETKALNFLANATSDAQGHYVVEVEGEHEEDMCEVRAVNSPDVNCSVPMDDMTVSRIECTINSGMHTPVRFANPLGFMTNEIAPECASVIKELFVDDDN